MDLDLERIQSALSSHYHSLVFLTQHTVPESLVSALRQHLPHVALSEWPSRLARGGTYINGEVVLHETTLPVPCCIEYFEPKQSLDQGIQAYGEGIADFVVFEDQDLLVVFKPAGISSLPTREQKFLNLKTFLEDYLQRSSPSSSLHMPSRVDTSVSGLVVSSKNASSHAFLQRAFEHRRVEKYYLLEADGSVPWESLTADRPIDRDPRHPILRRTVERGGKPSSTIFSVVKRRAEQTLLQAKPITGRTHQIRVHAASYGFPIVGDNFYGGSQAPQLKLMSYRCTLQHPGTLKPISFQVPDRLLPEWVRAWE